MKTKALLCCMNRKPWLVRNESDKYWYTMQQFELDTYKNVKTFNGKIIAECDFEVEEMKNCFYADNINCFYRDSRLTFTQLKKYLQDNKGYAIHIKNLHIFDYPKETSEFYTRSQKVVSDIICDSCTNFDFDCKKCPNNYEYESIRYIRHMMRVYDEARFEEYIAIPVTPEEMGRISNGEQTIIVKKKVLKEMKTNE